MAKKYMLPIMEELYGEDAKVRKSGAVRYFSMSGNKGIDNPSHYPVIALLIDNGKPTATPLSNKDEVLNLPDETVCMGQWAGENRSDFFEFTAKEYKDFNEVAKQARKEEEERQRKLDEEKERQRLERERDIEEEKAVNEWNLAHPTQRRLTRGQQSKLDRAMIEAMKILNGHGDKSQDVADTEEEEKES